METSGFCNVRLLRDTPYTSCGTRTDAVRRVLNEISDPTVIADLLFLEAWESGPMSSIAATMRAAQIRRANPELAAQIRKETQRMRAASSGHTAALGAASLRFPSIQEDNDDRPEPETATCRACLSKSQRWWRVDTVSEWICWNCEPPVLNDVESSNPEVKTGPRDAARSAVLQGQVKVGIHKRHHAWQDQGGGIHLLDDRGAGDVVAGGQAVPVIHGAGHEAGGFGEP